MKSLPPEVQRCRESFSHYMAVVHETDMPEVFDGRAVVPPHLQQVAARFGIVAGIVLKTDPRAAEWARSPLRHTSVVMPPGWGKTTLLQGFYEWLIGRASMVAGKRWAEQLHIAHISHAAEQAWRVGFAVRQTVLGNELYHAIFPAVKPHSEKFSQHEWRVAGCDGKDPTFVAMGVRGPILGNRLSFLGMDDLIKQPEGQDEVVLPSDYEVRQVIDWIKMTAMQRLVPYGCAWMNHTRWLENDPPGWAKERGWRELLVTALDEDGQSRWPARKSTEELLKEREEDPEGFSLQFMGEPMPSHGITFRPEHFGRFDELPLRAEGARVLTVQSWDTAGTRNPRSDFTAGWTALVDAQTWNVYLVNLYHDKLEFDQLLQAIIGQHMHMRSDIVLIEDKATGQPAAQLLRRTESMNILPVKPFGERGQPRLQDAINQIRPMLAAGKVHLPSERFAVAHRLAWLPTALRQLYAYPRAKHDDIARALIQLLYQVVLWDRQGWFQAANARPAVRWGTRQETRVLV